MRGKLSYRNDISYFVENFFTSAYFRVLLLSKGPQNPIQGSSLLPILEALYLHRRVIFFLLLLTSTSRYTGIETAHPLIHIPEGSY